MFTHTHIYTTHEDALTQAESEEKEYQRRASGAKECVRTMMSVPTGWALRLELCARGLPVGWGRIVSYSNEYTQGRVKRRGRNRRRNQFFCQMVPLLV